jgi:hypothetical protein
MRMPAARSPHCSLFRDLQRRHAVAVVLVHHARKGAGAIRAGQALRESSEFHAWGDSNLYLRRDSDDRIILTVEHRAAAAMQGVTLELTQRSNAFALQTVQSDCQPDSRTAPASIDHRIAADLADARQPQPFSERCGHPVASAPQPYKRLAAMTAAGGGVKVSGIASSRLSRLPFY